MKTIFPLLIVLTLSLIFLGICSVEQESIYSNELGITSPDSETPIHSQINLPDFAFFLNDSVNLPIQNSFTKYLNEWETSSFITLSLIRNEKDYAINATSFNEENNINNFDIHDIKNVYIKDYYDKQSTGYEELLDDTIIYSYIGDRKSTSNKVKYLNYIVEKNKLNQEWIECFQDIISNETGLENTPIIIQESFEFKINGLNAFAVNAGNLDIFYDYEQIYKIDNNTNNIKPIYPFVKYRLSAVFIDGYDPIIVFSDIKVYENTKYWGPIKKGESFNENTVYVYAQDLNDDIKRFPYKSSINTDRTSTTQIEYFICDIDNNGIEDIIWIHDGQGSQYLLKNAISLIDDTIIKRSLYPVILEYSTTP